MKAVKTLSSQAEQTYNTVIKETQRLDAIQDRVTVELEATVAARVRAYQEQLGQYSVVKEAWPMLLSDYAKHLLSK